MGFTCIWLVFMVNVGKHTSPMDSHQTTSISMERIRPGFSVAQLTFGLLP